MQDRSERIVNAVVDTTVKLPKPVPDEEDITERRNYPRYAVSDGVSLHLNGAVHDCRMIDISEGGATFVTADNLDVHPLDTGTVGAKRFGVFTFVIKHKAKKHMGVEFVLSDNDRTALRGNLADHLSTACATP